MCIRDRGVFRSQTPRACIKKFLPHFLNFRLYLRGSTWYNLFACRYITVSYTHLNTVRIMQEVPCLIAVLNTNQHTPFASLENEKRIVEICDSLSIGAAIENMILTATGYGLGTLWIANTCFAYNELMDFIGTDSQLTGIVAVGFADEAPDKRPRKPFEEIVEYR